MTTLCLLLALAYAPAPIAPPKAPAPLSPVGEWVLDWCDGTGPATFSADGGFSCVWQGQFWIGTWTLADGVLSVDEHIPAADEWGQPLGRIRWSATLEKGKLEGPLDGSAGLRRFRLRKWKKEEGKP